MPRSGDAAPWLPAVGVLLLGVLVAVLLASPWPAGPRPVVRVVPDPVATGPTPGDGLERTFPPESGPVDEPARGSPDPVLVAAREAWVRDVEGRLLALQEACGVGGLEAVCQGDHCAFTYAGAVGPQVEIAEYVRRPRRLAWQAAVELGWLDRYDTPCGRAARRAYGPGWSAPVQLPGSPQVRHCPVGTRTGAPMDLATGARLCNELLWRVEGRSEAVFGVALRD